MLLSFAPRTRVSALVRHHVDTVTLSLIELVESFIASTILVVLNAKTINLLIQPISSELAAICPLISSETLDYIIFVITGVRLIVRPLLYSISISFVIDVISIERASIWPDFRANSLLLALSKLSFVAEMVYV